MKAADDFTHLLGPMVPALRQEGLSLRQIGAALAGASGPRVVVHGRLMLCGG